MTLEPIIITVIVNKDPEATFSAFTQKMSDWWPLNKHSVGAFVDKVDPDTVVIEGHIDGRIYEVSHDGTERMWGVVTDWTPNERLAFKWHPGKDRSLATSVAVAFAATDAGKTAITLTHSGWDILGDTAQDVRENYTVGWAHILQNCLTNYLDPHI